MQGHIRSAVPRGVVAAKAIVAQAVAERPAGFMPPDPDEMNDSRAAWAQAAVTEFQRATGTEDSDALADLLNGLLHLVDRRDHEPGWNFMQALRRALCQYTEEIEEKGPGKRS